MRYKLYEETRKKLEEQEHTTIEEDNNKPIFLSRKAMHPQINLSPMELFHRYYHYKFNLNR